MLYLRKNPRNFSPFRFADHKLSIKSRILFMRESEVNILGKGENSHNQHCLLFAECFRKRKKKKNSKKSGLSGKGVNYLQCNIHLTFTPY